jgi:hypothetical protein
MSRSCATGAAQLAGDQPRAANYSESRRTPVAEPHFTFQDNERAKTAPSNDALTRRGRRSVECRLARKGGARQSVGSGRCMYHSVNSLQRPAESKRIRKQFSNTLLGGVPGVRL